jgi:hypothetical protein
MGGDGQWSKSDAEVEALPGSGAPHEPEGVRERCLPHTHICLGRVNSYATAAGDIVLYIEHGREDTTRHDTTRHDTTRYDTTRYRCLLLY